MVCSTPGLPCPSSTPRVYSNSCPSSQWCHPAISSSVIPFFSCPQSLPAIKVFSNGSALCIKWPKYWSFSFIISPSNEYSGLIFFRMDWFDLLAVQGTLKSLLQHHSSKASILRQSAFFIVQFSHLTILEKHLGHRVSDVIQPFHSLLSPSPPAPNPSQHRYLFQWVISSHEAAKVLGFQLQHLSFQWTLRTDL